MSDVFGESYMGSSDSLPQTDGAFSSINSYNPVNELMRAIILRTIEDLQSGGILREEAEEYLHDPDEEYIFSFISICRHLGFDPLKTRAQILNPGRRISTRRRAA